MPGREDIFQKAMNDGHSAAWDQEWDKAVAAYRQALQEFPDHPKGAQQPRAGALSTRQYRGSPADLHERGKDLTR